MKEKEENNTVDLNKEENNLSLDMINEIEIRLRKLEDIQNNNEEEYEIIKEENDRILELENKVEKIEKDYLDLFKSTDSDLSDFSDDILNIKGDIEEIKLKYQKEVIERLDALEKKYESNNKTLGDMKTNYRYELYGKIAGVSCISLLLIGGAIMFYNTMKQ